MINQTTLRTSVTVTHTFSVNQDSATVTVQDMTGTVLINEGTASVTDNVATYTVDSTVVEAVSTLTLIWKGTEGANITTVYDYLDINYVTRTRYCYQQDIRRKLIDIMLPADFDLGAYSARASNEIDRALQGLYGLPLAPTSDMDILSLRELSSDIAAGYAIEDLTVLSDNRANYYNNNLKVVGFAELRRYSSMEKVFMSLTQTPSKDGLHYQYSAPRISSFQDNKHNGNLYKDPLNRYYDGTKKLDNV